MRNPLIHAFACAALAAILAATAVRAQAPPAEAQSPLAPEVHPAQQSQAAPQGTPHLENQLTPQGSAHVLMKAGFLVFSRDLLAPPR
jgi:hypothetical protein